jgi:hypothetical protein
MGARGEWPDPRLLRLFLWAAAAALSGFTLLRGIGPHDEGLMLQAAQRIADGELPYRDFWFNYGPGQPLLLAGLIKAFGPSLLWWRILRVGLDATVALLAFVLARRRASLEWSLLAWAAAAGAMAWPSSPGPNPAALALGLGAILLARRSPAGAGTLAGLAAVFRLELGAAAALGALVAASAERAGPGLRAPWISREGVRALGTAMLVAALAWLPFVLADPRATFDDTVGFFDEQRLQRLPFPWHYHGAAAPFELLRFYFPLVLLAGLALWALAALLRRATREEAALLPLAVAGALYLLARTDTAHLIPLAAVLPVLLAIAAVRAPLAVLRIALAAVLVLVVLHGWQRRASQALHPPDQIRLTAPAADGVRADAADAAALNRLVPYVDARVPPGRPVFVANPRHDRVRVGDTLLYVLLGRPSATEYDIMQPGVVTTAAVQAKMIASLESSRPALVVRWTNPNASRPEPNGAGRSSGVFALDRYLARNYRPAARFGDYTVLARVRTARGSAPAPRRRGSRRAR